MIGLTPLRIVGSYPPLPHTASQDSQEKVYIIVNPQGVALINLPHLDSKVFHILVPDYHNLATPIGGASHTAKLFQNFLGIQTVLYRPKKPGHKSRVSSKSPSLRSSISRETDSRTLILILKNLSFIDRKHQNNGHVFDPIRSIGEQTVRSLSKHPSCLIVVIFRGISQNETDYNSSGGP